MATEILLLRHAEKPDDAAGILGVTEAGREDRNALSVTGWQRAGALVPFMLKRQPAADRIYASAFREGGGHSRRPEQTVRPLAQRLGLRIDLTWALHQEQAFGAVLAAEAGSVVVCWQHQGLADLARAIAAPHVIAGLPANWRWPADRYDVIWSLRRAGPHDRWRLREYCPRLLAGDSAQPLLAAAPDAGA